MCCIFSPSVGRCVRQVAPARPLLEKQPILISVDGILPSLCISPKLRSLWSEVFCLFQIQRASCCVALHLPSLPSSAPSRVQSVGRNRYAQTLAETRLSHLQQILSCPRLLLWSRWGSSNRKPTKPRAILILQHNTWIGWSPSWCPLGGPAAVQARKPPKHKPFAPRDTTQWLLREVVSLTSFVILAVVLCHEDAPRGCLQTSQPVRPSFTSDRTCLMV